MQEAKESWLKPGQEVKEATGSSKYYRFEEGANRFRIITQAENYFSVWSTDSDGKAVIHRSADKNELTAFETEKNKVKLTWAMVVADYESGGLMELELDKQSVINAIREIALSGQDPSACDMQVTKSGSGMNTHYTTQALAMVPKSADLQAAVDGCEFITGNFVLGEEVIVQK